jgi:hypothetical protein
MALGKESEQSALAVNLEVLRIGYDFNGINCLASQAIDGAEDLQRSNEIKLVNRGHHYDDDASASVLPGAIPIVAVLRLLHPFAKYVGNLCGLQQQTVFLAEIIGYRSQTYQPRCS